MTTPSPVPIQFEPLWQRLSAIEGVETLGGFGSRAVGQPDATSDLDLFMIVSTGRLKDFEFLTALSQGLSDLRESLQMEIDLCLYERDDFNQQLADRNPFLESILAQAQEVHGRKLPPLPEAEPPAPVVGPLTDSIRPLGRAISSKLCQHYWELATLSLRDAAFPALSGLGKVSAATMTLQALAGLALELTGRRSRRNLPHPQRVTAAFEVLALEPKLARKLARVLRLQQRIEAFEIFDASEKEVKEVVLVAGKCYREMRAWALKACPGLAVPD